MLAVRPLPSGDDHGAARGVPAARLPEEYRAGGDRVLILAGPIAVGVLAFVVDPDRVLRTTTAVLNSNLRQNDQTPI